MTIVEFAEKILGTKLLDYQKKYLEMLYEKYKQEGPLIFHYPNRLGAECVRVAWMYFNYLEGRGELDDNNDK